jgi:hypothetical protein
MTTECAECEKFEKQFIAARSKRTELLLGGKVTGEILATLTALDEEELAALSAMMDHKIQHRLAKRLED